MAINFNPADYAPTMLGYSGQQPFRFWCQKVLPLVYDDSLSYYELLNKVVDYLNNTIADVSSVETNVDALNTSFGNLQTFVNTNVGNCVEAFNELNSYVSDYFTNLDVQEEINTKLDAMALDGTLTNLILATDAIPDAVSEWLSENITPTTPVVDASLSVSGAAADAKVTGDKIAVVKSEVEELYNQNTHEWKTTETYPCGWRTGYWNATDGTREASDRYMCSAYFVQFESDVPSFKITAPSGYAVAVNEYSTNELASFIRRIGNMDYTAANKTTELEVPVHEGYAYLFSVGRWNNNDAEDYLNDEFVATILLKYRTKPEELELDDTLTQSGDAADAKAVGDKFAETDNDIDDIMLLIDPLYEERTFDWSTIPYGSYSTGWRTGYFGLSTGTANSSSRYIRTLVAIKFDKTTPLFTITAPTIHDDNTNTDTEYYVAVLVYDSSYNFVESIGNMDATASNPTHSVTVETNPNYYYRFNVGRWAGNDAGDYLNTDFVSQIILKYKQLKNPYKARQGEMTFFTVDTNVTVEPTDSLNTHATLYTSYTCNAVISLPETYDINGEPVPLIMLCHGQSARVNATDHEWFGNSADFLRLLRGFTAAGYAVFDVGSTNPDNNDIAFADWGNPALMGAYIKAWEYIKENYNVEHKLYLYSESMGTMAALNMLKWYPSEIIAAINSAPRTNLEAQLSQTTQIGGYPIGDAIRLRYGIASGTTLPHDLLGYDNYNQIVTINSTDYVFHQFPPLKVLAGANDSPDGSLPQTRAYYAALINAGNVVYYREVADVDHHDMCYLIPGNTLQECVEWFNRFRHQES